MSALERHCRWLLRAYPAWYRRERSEEMLGTLLEASPPGRKWPTFRDARALVTGGLRARGWAWLLAMLWVAAGAVFNGYIFYLTTMPLLPEDMGIAGWAEISVPLQIVIAVAVVVFCAALIPAPIAGFIRLRGWRRGNWRRAAAWAGAWTAGLALFWLSGYWGGYPIHSCPNSPGNSVPPQCPPGSPAVVSWGELPLCAAWLVLGALMTWVLAVPPARRSGVPSTSSQASGKAIPPDSPFSRL